MEVGGSNVTSNLVEMGEESEVWMVEEGLVVVVPWEGEVVLAVKDSGGEIRSIRISRL